MTKGLVEKVESERKLEMTAAWQLTANATSKIIVQKEIRQALSQEQIVA
jgi:hypothetical protein